MIKQTEFTLHARARGFHVVTSEIIKKIPKLPQTGILHLFIKHTSAALSINENADPDVQYDLNEIFNRLVRERENYYLHTSEGDDDMPSHAKSTIIGESIMIPISNGRLNMGIWQGIYLCEFRNRASGRSIVATVIEWEIQLNILARYLFLSEFVLTHFSLLKQNKMDISDLLSVFTNSDNLSALSQSTGAKPSQVSDLVSKAIPILMKGMQQNAASENGASSLANALEQHANNNVSDVSSFLKNLDVSDGSKILGHILGNKNNEVQNGLAQKTGLSSSQTNNLLASIAPMLLSVLGGQKRQSNVSSSGLGGMLSSLLGGSSGGGLDSMISSALADNDGDGKPDILQKLGGLFGFGK